jgi:hypothetical protein
MKMYMVSVDCTSKNTNTSSGLLILLLFLQANLYDNEDFLEQSMSQPNLNRCSQPLQ